ncbi:tetratricopeptide repeat protein [Spirochaeta isovalerica]|uniref:TPR repeat-containing protein n=1 Tax=Spirochaeta isovalerica TaxID=150 RepID=A0A841R8A7_9SPIO|nr:tetratricopeptide repeat protein [Spirochaeta isovalerica]MBB6478968.1 hypothetical protein [Spirochaeta isovalerica]
MISKKILPLCLLAVLTSCTSMPEADPGRGLERKSLYEQHIEGAMAGNISDQIEVGKAYEEGAGVPVDFEQAMAWYKKASAKGDPEAYFHIGQLYERGRGVPVSEEDAREWYYSAAVNRYVPAIRKLIIILEGQENEQLQWIRKGVEAEDPYSYYRYGLILEETDREEALKLFRSADAVEDASGKALIAILSLGGKLNAYSDHEALEILQRAVDDGDPRSQVFLGWLYEFGDSLKKSSEKALELYENAARWNSQLAIFNLSRFYGEGIGVAENTEQSNLFFSQLDNRIYPPSYYDLLDYATRRSNTEQLRVLYRFKASQGDSAAQYELGKLSDREDAFQWFWLAAQEGYVPAMVELSRVYLAPDTSMFDPVEGAAWLMVAENSGFEDEDFTISKIVSDFSEEEKLQVSERFTELFYRDPEVPLRGNIP